MPAMIIAVLLYLTLMVVCGRYTAKYAAQRRRSRAAWFVWGALFFPFPYLVLALLPRGTKANGSPTPPSAKRGPAGGSPTAQGETPSRTRNDTTGYTRRGLVPVKI